MTNEKAYKVALVGCGAVSKLYYTPALKALENENLVQVAALFDPDLQNSQLIKKSFPGAVLKEINDLFAHEIDLAIIASPPQFHPQQAIHLLTSGIAVLCEKPIAASVSEAELMIKAASSSGKELAIGHFRRFFPATQTIKKILSEDLLGEITSFNFSEGGVFMWPITSATYFKRSVSKGGVLLDIGIHLIDLMLWWLGHPDKVVYEDDAMGGIEVNCRIFCSFKQGFSGEIRLSRDTSLQNKYVIVGTKGWLAWNVNDAPDKVQIGFKDSSFVLDAQICEADSYYPFSPGSPSQNFEQSFISQLLNVIDALSGRTSLLVPAEEGIKSLRLIETCYQHRRLMSMPWLNKSEFERAQQLNNER